MSASSQRGTGLMEVLVSMAILGIATAGIAEMQLVVARVNSIAQSRTQAIQLADRVAEAVQSWAWSDPRLASQTVSVGAYATPLVVADTTDTMSVTPQFALGPYAGAAANDQRLMASGTADPLLPGPAWDDLYRVYWTVRAEDMNSDGIEDARLVSITVRWREGGAWHDFNTVQARFNPATLIPNYN